MLFGKWHMKVAITRMSIGPKELSWAGPPCWYPKNLGGGSLADKPVADLALIAEELGSHIRAGTAGDGQRGDNSIGSFGKFGTEGTSFKNRNGRRSRSLGAPGGVWRLGWLAGCDLGCARRFRLRRIGFEILC